jgi:protein-tyrosine phosphatase
VDFEGVTNFRDFGGQPTGDGRRVRSGVLYRSGHLGAVTDADLERLAELDFSLVVDLRRAAERKREVSRLPGASRVKVLEHAGPLEAAVAPHLTFLSVPDATPELVTQQMTVGYRGYPFDPYYVTLYRDYFAELARLEGRVLVHCHAGKDRTGVLCALTLHLLGVDREQIVEDYLLTNRRGRADARLEEMRGKFQRERGKPVDDALLKRLMKADRVYLEAAFDAIAAEHGSVEAYLDERVGVTPQVRAAIRERLLA